MQNYSGPCSMLLPSIFRNISAQYRNISVQYLSKYIPWRHLDALVARVPVHGRVFQENSARIFETDVYNKNQFD